MYLEIKDIIVRNTTSNDVKALHTWQTDGEVMAHTGYPLGLNITVNEILNQLNNNSDKAEIRLIIEQNNISIGEMVYRKICDGTAEIEIKICNNSYQNREIGSKILDNFINALIEEYNYNKTVLSVDVKNLQARHVYIKLGFDLTSFENSSWVNQIGESVSVAKYELEKKI